MPPPQLLPSDHHTTPRPRPRPRPPARESSVPVVPAAKRPPPQSAPAAAKKMARPTSAPDLTAAAAATRPRPRPPSTQAKNGHPAAKGGSGSERPAFLAPCVRPARRLTPGTAVYVRTTFRPSNVNIRCRILLWLRARVVSSPDAYHFTVKYAADLSDMFAGKIVSKPAEHVRLAPRPTHAKPKSMAKEAAASLPRR